MPASNDLGQICTIRIELADSEPLIWREVEAPTWITLDDLHDIIQIVMGWENEHLWEFTVGKQQYAPPDEFAPLFQKTSDSGDVMLSEILRPRRTTFRYLYDFGDSWNHRVIVTKIRAPEAGVAYPRYIGGERNGPPEDCGGLYGFQEGLAAITKYDAGGEAADGEASAGEESDEAYDMEGWAQSFTPDYVDVEDIENELHLMAEHLKTRKRPRAKKPEAKSAQASRDDRAMADTVKLMIDALRLGAATRPTRPRVARK